LQYYHGSNSEVSNNKYYKEENPISLEFDSDIFIKNFENVEL